MVIFDFWKRRKTKRIEDIIKEVNELLPAELDREEDLLEKLKNLVVFLGSEKQKEIESILSSGKGFLTGNNLPPNLQTKFEVLTSYPFYQDFLKDKDLKKLEENLSSFSSNEDLNLTLGDITIIKSSLEYDIGKVRKLNYYFKELDLLLKSISLPLKLLRRRGIRLRELYIELRDYLQSESNKRYLRRFKKDDVLNLARVIYRKLEEYSFLDKLIGFIDQQRILTRRARHLSFNYKNDEALECIDKIKKLVAEILSDENKRLLGMINLEEIDLGSMTIDKSKLILRRKKIGVIRNSAIGICAAYSLYGVAVPFTLSSSTIPSLSYVSVIPSYTYVDAHKEIDLTIKVKRQEISIPSEFGDLKTWFYKSNNSDKIVLVTHAVNHNKSWERPLYKLLTDKGYNVIAFDFPGHGENEWKVGTVSYGYNESKSVMEVLKYLENSHYKEVVLIGQSMGAVSLIKAAAIYKGSIIIKAIAAGAAYVSVKESFHKTSQNLSVIKPLVDIGLSLGGKVSGVDYATFDLRPNIQEINRKGIPVFYYWGAKDNILSLDVVKPIQDLAKNSDTFKVYPEGKHTFYYEWERGERDNDVADYIIKHMNPN